MDSVKLLQSQFDMAHHTMMGTAEGVDPDNAHFQPGGRAASIAANLVHAVLIEDVFLNSFITGGTPLAFGEWAGRTGASELPDMQGGDNDGWDQRVTLDLEQGQQYAEAVFNQSTAYLASISSDDLDRTIDLTAFGMTDAEPISTVLNMILANNHWHTGEVSTIKGIQGLQGYPF